MELCDQKRNKRLEKEFLRIGFFELPKNTFEKPNHKYWRDYFIWGEAHPEAPEYIKKASQVINYVNLCEEERKVISTLERLEAYEQVEREYLYEEGKSEGRAEGMTEGITEGMEKMIIMALRNNISDEVVETMIKEAGIPESRIYELKKQAMQN